MGGTTDYALYPVKRQLPPHHEGGNASHTAALILPPEKGVPITWGGTITTDDSGLYHMFVDVCCYTPTSIMHGK
jgi:hypothetical protein